MSNYEALKEEVNNNESMELKIPQEIKNVQEKLIDAGFEAYLVGGCVRDILLGRTPKDWDITTNAKPEKIEALYEKSFYENKFGTVSVVTDSEDKSLKVVEITPYRIESKYSDKRHPDEIKFAKRLEDDLSRRDFTVNAMALDPKSGEVIDMFDGQNSLKNKEIRAVGDAGERFDEDALRIMRAVRLAAELGFIIEDDTKKAIQENSESLGVISKERIRDEFVKMIMSDNPDKGLEMMRELGILKHILPELEEGFGETQNKHHIYTVWEHNIRALMHTVENKQSLDIRIGALLHDIGKPRSKRGEGPDSTFYGHEVIGARMTKEILSRLKFSKKFVEKITKLVRYHLFFSDTEVITLSAVRRVLTKVGPENIGDLLKIRYADRIGMGRPKERPFRLRKYEAMIEEVQRDPLSVSMLKIDGSEVMKLLKITPGPRVGDVLNILLDEVLDDPKRNTIDYLKNKTEELSSVADEKLTKMAQDARKRNFHLEEEAVKEIRKKYHVN